MCGIFGFIRTSPGPSDPAREKALLGRLLHRGPDDKGVLYVTGGGTQISQDPEPYSDVAAGFLHRRLSILDLSEAGRQPMSTPDGRYYLSFNGEIYNYEDLRMELERLGHTFHSTGDTEVLLHALATWGTEALPRLVGMFALSLLDTAERKMLLARDFAGIKPLYYSQTSEGFAFASEITPLLDLPGVSRRINPQRAYDYLRHGLTDHGGETTWADVRQLPSCHFMWVDLDRPDRLIPERYTPAVFQREESLSFEQAAEKLRETFLESIRLHMQSDVPVGAALSGGIDSSAVVSGMRHLYPDAELHAFSYIATDPRISEERWIDLVGAHAGLRLHKVSPTPDEMVADLDELIRIQEEPFGSTSIYAQFRVFKLAREAGIKVMLDGQGADELFGGYKLHVAARLASMIRKGEWSRAWQYVRHLKHSPMAGGRLNQVLYAMGMLAPEKVQAPMMRFTGREADPSWLVTSWFEERGVRRSPHQWRSESKEVLHEMLRRTFEETSLPMLLRYEDRNSMAFSIESRVPFVTPPLLYFVSSLPESFLIDDRATTKAIFRKAMRGIVPDAILDRRDKVAFATPETEWLARMKPWVESVLGSETINRIPLLDPVVVRESWQNVLNAKTGEWRTVWRWINFVRWADQQQIVFDD